MFTPFTVKSQERPWLSCLFVGQAFQPAIEMSSVQTGWKACPTRLNGNEPGAVDGQVREVNERIENISDFQCKDGLNLL
jgi:hypothetical protein